jgi:insulysin
MYRLFLASVLTLSIPAYSIQFIKDTNSVDILTPSFKAIRSAKIKLDNGLEAYIISDPLLKESGAALAVAAGSWDDPVEYPGMAHFLEHMLFMGTKAYPDEAEYSSFIQSHGGAMNAYTASDKTVYSFSINPTDFEGALDRFSHFFIDPLFSMSSLSRELHNVDQEHAKNVENDGSRIYQVFKDTANKDHPVHAFSTGNAETLSDIPTAVMKEFYEKYYSSDRMHLVIMDKAPLDTLVASVKAKFNKVPVSKFQRTLPQTSILSTAQKGALLKICPLKETKSLSLIWELGSSYVTDFDSRTADFLCYLLSSEAPGQLAELLKSKGYTNQFSASKDDFSHTQGLISLDMDLTASGLENKEEIIQICFNYLKYLSSNKQLQPIYDQWKSIIKTKYVYQDRQDVFSEVTDLAADLIDQPLANFPSHGQIPSSFDMDKFIKLIAVLKPESALYILMNNQGQFDQKEPWTGASYNIKPWSSEDLYTFNEVEKSLSFNPIEVNPYAPTQFYLTSQSEQSQFYETLEQSETLNLYYKPTNLYGLPECSIRLKMTPAFPMVKEDLAAFLSLFVGGFNKKLMFDLDAAAYCGLRGRLFAQDGFLYLSLEGFNDKTETLFTKMTQNLSSFSLSKEDFDLIKQLCKESLSNTSKELGFRQGLIRFNALFDSTGSLPYDVNQALKNWDYERFSKLAKNLSESFKIEGLVIGNASKTLADSINQELKTLSSSKPVAQARIQKVLELDDHKGPFIYKKNLEVQGSSLILAISQEKTSEATRARTALLMPLLSEQFFDTLRTKQHTGYIAKAFDKEIAQQQFYIFGVQSNSHGALELLYRFELFIEEFVNNFDSKYSQKQFESVKNSLIAELSARKENLSTLAMHDLYIITNRDGDFNWDEKLIKAVQNTTYEELKEFAFKTLPRSNPKRVAFLMEGKLPQNRKLIYSVSTLEGIQSQGQFTQPLLLQPKAESDEYSKKLLLNTP